MFIQHSGKKPLVKITRDMVLKLIASKRKEGTSASTVRNFLAPVRSIYYQGIESGSCHKNPAARLGKFNKEKEKEPGQAINPLTREEVAKFLKHHRASHWHPVFLLAHGDAPGRADWIETRRIGF